MKTITLKLYDYIELAENAGLNDNGRYFTKDGEFMSYDEVEELIDKLELIEKAYNVKFDVEEK